MPNRLNSIAALISAFCGHQRSLKLALGFTAAWGILPTVVGQRVIVINTSPSVAPGLYLRCARPPIVGQIIDFRMPNAARHYIQGRTGEDGQDWYILKPIAAGPGDRVDTTGSFLIIDGRTIAPMPPSTDTAGRLLPVWRESRVLGPDEFFVFSARIANSFDSRCYGPIQRREVMAVRHALITW